tara:strand:+ start:244 stop:417 length:174 start_codon:yes stop_codon:yes gene_type:complete
MNRTYEANSVRNTVPDFWSMEGVLAYERMCEVAQYRRGEGTLDTESFYLRVIEGEEV